MLRGSIERSVDKFAKLRLIVIAGALLIVDRRALGLLRQA
jgi:hypothetical protein